MTIRVTSFLSKADEFDRNILFFQTVVHQVYYSKASCSKLSNKLKLAKSNAIIVVFA